MSEPTNPDFSEDTLPPDPEHRAFEIERRIKARRQAVISRLPLSDQAKEDLEDALNGTTWPANLSRIAPPSSRPGPTSEPWTEQDVRALLCLRRHSELSFPLIHEYFFSDREEEAPVKLWEEVMNGKIRGWREEYDRALLQLYHDEQWTFEEIRESPLFTYFSILALEIAYAQATRPKMPQEKPNTSLQQGEEEDADDEA